MSTTTDDHLSDNQVFQMLLDPADLPETQKAHLATCQQCRKALDRLQDDLQRVENLARATAPKPIGKFQLPIQQAKGPISFFSGLRPLPRLAVSALALLLVIGTVLFVAPGQKSDPIYEASQMIDPDQLLSEIDELVETPFAPEFLTVTSANDVNGDEDFMEYIVPIIENDPITRTLGKKGESLC